MAAASAAAVAAAALSFHSTPHFSCSPSRPAPWSNASRRRPGGGFAVFSTHSNPRILKSNRRSRTGRQVSPYDDSDEEDEHEGESDDKDYDDDFSDMEDGSSGRNFPKLAQANKMTGRSQAVRRGRESTLSKSGQSLSLLHIDDKIAFREVSSKDYQYNLSTLSDMDYEGIERKSKLKNENFSTSKFQKLTEEFDFDEKWFPLIEYLSTFGLKDSHFISIYERHMPSLQINLASAQERLEFLLSVGVKQRDIRRILVRQPQILEYTVENNLKAHVAFLVGIGVPSSRIGQIITAAPSLFSYSVEHSLKPTISYLIEEIGIKEQDISKVVQLSPQILVQRLDNSWTSRFSFLSKELGASKESIVKMVTKHPQLLHYSIEDGILPRINFLRSIGMRNSDILKVLTSLTQVLSLSLEENLKPKYLYLVNELRNEVQSLTKYPTYLSLSLEQRIRPRHRFLVSLKKAPKGPFPLSSFVPTDEHFCRQWAGTSLDKYLAFRQNLQLADLSKKYDRRR